MTPQEFSALALGFDGTVESAHMNHPDFRVEGKIFATLAYPNEEWGMVKLTPEQQRTFVEAEPKVFRPCSGKWGERGCTNVRLAPAKKRTIKAALQLAIENVSVNENPKSQPHAKTSQKTSQKAGATRLKEADVNRARRHVLKILTSLPEAAANPSGAGHLSLEVRRKRFGYFLVNHHGDGRLALSLKTVPGSSRKWLLAAPERYHVPKYVGHRGWIGIWLDVPPTDWDEVEEAITDAYRQVAPQGLLKALD